MGFLKMNKEEFIKAYKNDKDIALKVFDEMNILNNAERVNISYKINFLNRNYSVQCEIPKGLKLVRYLAEYILISELINKGKIKKYRMTEFKKNNGSIGFYLKKQLEFINNIKVIENEY